MPRKKVTKTAKGKKLSAKQNTKTKVALSLTETLERDFRDAPAKLIAQFRKELAALTQQEKKLKAEFKKANAQKKAAKKQQVTLFAKAKKSASTALKKQVAAAKQAVEKATKTVLTLSVELNQIKQQVKSISQHQAKFAALHKHFVQFEKMWALKAKKSAKPVSGTRKKSIKKQATSNDQSQQDDRTTHETQPVQTNVREAEIVE